MGSSPSSSCRQRCPGAAGGRRHRHRGGRAARASRRLFPAHRPVQTADMQWTYEVEGIPTLRPTSGRP
ncbi:hypothetical protein GN956_G25815 [Arapaima gigas]